MPIWSDDDLARLAEIRHFLARLIADMWPHRKQATPDQKGATRPAERDKPPQIASGIAPLPNGATNGKEHTDTHGADS